LINFSLKLQPGAILGDFLALLIDLKRTKADIPPDQMKSSACSCGRFRF
jgi:hypothetical protein